MIKRGKDKKVKVKQSSQKKNSKAQMEIGFGVIFSIILIVIFIAFAAYAISKFLEMQNFAKVEKFKSDFQDDIDKMWKSTQGSQEVQYYLPKAIKQVCFMQEQKDPMTSKSENMYFVPTGFSPYLIQDVDITKTIAPSTTVPKTLCINTTSDGTISMTIGKAYNEDQVTITK